LMLLSFVGQTQSVKVGGYYIDKSNERVDTQFVIPIAYFSSEPKVLQLQEAITLFKTDDQAGDYFEPKDITAYFFRYDNTDYFFQSMPNKFSQKNRAKRLFIRVAVDGKVRLLKYYYHGRKDGGLRVTNRYPFLTDDYLEKEGQLTKVRQLGFRKKMSQYFSDFIDLSEVIASGGLKINDLSEIVKIYNRHNSK
ncbi:MAG: hypothetical protein AAF990_24185, partial [Bacteroidota bacterium]